MKFKNLFLLLILCFGSYSINAQSDTLRADFIDTRIDDKVIVANCDTFNITFDFSAPAFTEVMPIEISQDYVPFSSDYWLNEPNLTITEDNPFWNLQIYLENTPSAVDPDFIRFKIKDSENEQEKFNIYFIPEMPSYSLIPQFDDESFVLCETTGYAEFSIEPDSTFYTQVPYSFDFFVTNTFFDITFEENISGDYLYVGETFGITASAPSLDIKVHALNCVFELPPYPVSPSSTTFSDTIFCKNESIDYYGSTVSYPTSSKVHRLNGAAENSCDSLLELHIEYLPVNFTTQQIIKTEEESVVFYDSTLTDFGTYFANDQNIYGCDSSEILSLVPFTSLDYLAHFPDELTVNESICDDNVCLPFYINNTSDYRFLVNSVPYEFSELGFCVGEMQEVTSINIQANFISGGVAFWAENISINEQGFSDIYFGNLEELINGLNEIYPTGRFMKGFDEGEIFSFDPELSIRFSYRNLQTQDRRFLGFTGVNQRTLSSGISLPLELGFNDLRIEHKTYPFAKDIGIFVYSESDDLLEPIIIDYAPELNTRLQFPILSAALCGNITSAQNTCPENWEGFVDYSLTNDGILTFKALKAYNSVACIEICDEAGNCTTVNLQLNFDGERTDLNALSYNIFPNPATDILHITHEPNIHIARINLFDINGIRYNPDIFIHKNVAEVRVNNLVTGLYFLEIQTENGDLILEKIVVNN